MAKILLVEDDNNLREIYEARLQAEGYQIVSANDGEAALVVAKNEKPDLVISDVMMPKISGFEMLDILRNTEGLQDVKVIMLTALGQADDQARANKLGADRYLVKSQVTLEDIVRVSHELLEGAAPAAPAASSDTPADAPATAGPTADTTAPATPSPAPTDVPDMPVAAPPTPEPTPAAAEPTTVTPANEPAAPTPPAADTVVPTPEPAPVPATDVAVPDAAQTSATEEQNVKQQIEDFVANQPATPPAAVEPAPDAAPAAAPEVTTPESSAQPVATADAANDSQVLASAVNTLVADAETEAQEAVAPAAEPTPSAPPVPPAPVTDDNDTTDVPANDAVNVAHKKVIQPLDSAPKKSLDELVAQEEANEAASGAVATPVVGGLGDEAPSGAPTPPPSTQAETAGPDPDKPLDPNSIAL